MQPETLDPELTKKLFEFAYDAHNNHNTAGQDHIIRRGLYPYVIHPMWAASTLVMDPDLPKEERILGFQILMLHDVLEDTSVALPDWVSQEVQEGVQMLSHESWEQELVDIESYPPFFKLLKLCDKVQTLYEKGVVLPEKRSRWKQLVQELARDVEAHYGNARIVVIANALTKHTDW